jgi:hypothetical protein
MHSTLSPSFIGYLDNTYISNGNLRISGWIVSNIDRNQLTYYIDIGHPVAFYNYNERQDVADFYGTNSNDYRLSGFDISIPTPNKEDVLLYAMVGDKKVAIFNINLNTRKEVPVSSLMDETSGELNIRTGIVPSFIVVDDFYSNPDQIRALALSQNYAPDLRYHKGQRTNQKYIAPGTKQLFESLLGKRITRWSEFEYNGIFQYCTAEDPLVYHSDIQSYAAAVYLNPNAPVECGTSFYRSKAYPDTRRVRVEDANYGDIFKGGFYDKTNFELVDTVGNVYNRLVIWDARLIHSASQYFGFNKDNSRLFHLFFFDVED